MPRPIPGKINMGTAGIGTTGHMAGELFKAMAGVDLVHVPYRGSAPAVTDLIGGQVQVMFDAMIVDAAANPVRQDPRARRHDRDALRRAAGRAGDRRDHSGL